MPAVSHSVSKTRDSFIRQIHSVLSEPHPSQPEAQDYSVIPYRYVPAQVKPSRLQTLRLQKAAKIFHPATKLMFRNHLFNTDAL